VQEIECSGFEVLRFFIERESEVCMPEDQSTSFLYNLTMEMGDALAYLVKDEHGKISLEMT
jgi:hypothetical protein